MRIVPCVVAALTWGCTAPADRPVATSRPAEPAAIEFRVRSEFGAQSDWTAAFLERAAAALVRLMSNPQVSPPRAIDVELKRDPNLAGIGGWATADSIGFVSDQWPAEANRYWILAHELSNLFAHHYGGAGGYPSDWWSNGRSPFPEYLSCVVMSEAGYPEESVWRKVINKGKPDHDLYWHLHERHGFALFARFFQLLRADAIDLGAIGKPWPAADETRSAYAIAYLSLAAGENLAGEFRRAGVGREPPDWRDRHRDLPFEAYEVTDDEVDSLMRRRGHLFGRNRHDPALQGQRQRFRLGLASNTPAVATRRHP
jgi:hypothetical protein